MENAMLKYRNNYLKEDNWFIPVHTTQSVFVRLNLQSGISEERENSNDSTVSTTMSCPRVVKTPVWLARHIQSNHAGLAEAVNSNLPPTQEFGAGEPEL
jgi:hypothetical protein